MRKNFLLLFLMTLLPFAGWADDLKDCTISVPNVVKGATSFGTPGIVVMHGATTLTKGTDYQIEEGYFVNESDATPYKVNNATATLAQLPVGDYYVKFTGLGGFATTSATKLFSVTGKPIATAATISSTAIAAVTYNGSAHTPSTTGRLTESTYTLVEGKDYTVAYSDNINAGTAKITYTGKGDYSGTTTENFTINPKSLTESMVTAVELSEMYKSAAFNTFAVNVKDGSKTLAAGTDFVVTIYDAHTAATATETETWGSAAEPINVATYYLAIENKANANYKVTGKIFAGTFKITKAGLRIAAINQKKNYDGSLTLPETAIDKAYTVSGLQGDDALEKIVTNITATASGDANYGTKTIAMTATNFTGTGSKNANYDIYYASGTLTINRLPITITPNAFTRKFNETDETATAGFNSAWPTAPTVGETSNVKGFKGVTVVETGSTSTATPTIVTTEIKKFFCEYKSKGDAADYAGIYVDLKANTPTLKGDYDEALEIKVTNAKASVLNNYLITYADGLYSIKGGKILISAVPRTKVYGDADPEFIYTVDGLSGKDKLKKEPTLTRGEEGEDVKKGGYTINISGAEAPAGYEDIIYATAKLTITKRPMTLTAYPQTLGVGKKATDLQQEGYIKVEGKASRDAAFTDFKATFTTAQVKDPKDASIVIADVPSTDASSQLDKSGVVKGGIICKEGDDAGTFKAANYEITYVYGDLNVVPTAAIVLDDTKDMKTTLNAANGKENYVTFSTRTVAAQSWNVMVLPFDITVSDLSKALGYAVVDVMDENASDGNVHFNLYMGEIKANTPFMFKVDGEKNNMIQFAVTKNVVYDLTNADKDAVKLDATGNSYITDKAGNKLIGTYHSTAINEGEYYLGNVSETPGVVVPGWKPAEANANPIKGERAILVMAAANGARQILVEEPDGTTTAIDVIAAEKVNTVKEGWYTLNGVKLQGVPTQKGIYINNGKKVVIK